MKSRCVQMRPKTLIMCSHQNHFSHRSSAGDSAALRVSVANCVLTCTADFQQFTKSHGGCCTLVDSGGCCTLVVDEEIRPLLCTARWVPRKAPYKCNKLLLLLLDNQGTGHRTTAQSRSKFVPMFSEILQLSYFKRNSSPKMKWACLSNVKLHKIRQT